MKMASKSNTKNGSYVLHIDPNAEDCIGSGEPAKNVKGKFPHQFKRNADGTAEQPHCGWSLITKIPTASSHDQVAPITQQPVKSGLVPAHVEPDGNLYPIEGGRPETKKATANSISAKSKESARALCTEKAMVFVATSIPDAEDEWEEYCQPDESWLYKSPRTKSIQEERFIARSKELGFPSDAGVDGTLPGRSIACQPRATIDVPPPNHVCKKLPEGTPLSNGGVVAYDNGRPLRVHPLNEHTFQAIRAEHSRSVCDEKIMFDWCITKKELVPLNPNS
jgi:hypothetical protein